MSASFDNLTPVTLEAIRTLFQEETQEMRADISILKTDVTDVKTDVRGLKSDVDGLMSDVTGLKSLPKEVKRIGVMLEQNNNFIQNLAELVSANIDEIRLGRDHEKRIRNLELRQRLLASTLKAHSKQLASS